MATVVVTQPTYLPWLGYFEQLARADTFVFLDSVQFVPRSWHSRNRLRMPGGPSFWLTVPVARHKRDTPINEIRISAERPDWKSAHLKSIQHALGSTPFFGRLFPEIEAWLSQDWELLVDLNVAGIGMIAGWLDLQPTFLRASELRSRGRSIELIVGICRELGADHYYSSLGSRSYLQNDQDAFARHGIELEYQSWQHPVYAQGRGEFSSHLTALDALCHLGPDQVRLLLTRQRPASTELQQDAALT